MGQCIHNHFSSSLGPLGINTIHGLYSKAKGEKDVCVIPLEYLEDGNALDVVGAITGKGKEGEKQQQQQEEEEAESITLSVLPISKPKPARKNASSSFALHSISNPYFLVLSTTFVTLIICTSLSSILSVPSKVVHSLVTAPLRTLYSSGPTIIGGWESLPLHHVCARITKYGDGRFWQNNIEECEKIYLAKENSFIAIARPCEC